MSVRVFHTPKSLEMISTECSALSKRLQPTAGSGKHIPCNLLDPASCPSPLLLLAIRHLAIIQVLSFPIAAYDCCQYCSRLAQSSSGLTRFMRLACARKCSRGLSAVSFRRSTAVAEARSSMLAQMPRAFYHCLLANTLSA